VIDLSLLEWCIREDLNKRAQRRLAVLRPLKLVITNLPDGYTETLQAVNNPEDPQAGSRPVIFSKELYIEQDDFMEVPPKKYFRLTPGQEVRLKYAYIIKCEEIIKDSTGNVVEIHCTYDPETRSGGASTKQVKGTIHWVSAGHCETAEVRLFDRLFTEPFMDNIPEGKDYKDFLNSNSLQSLTAFIEPALSKLSSNDFPVQFERLGYFKVDPDSKDRQLVFNRVVTLKDTWAKLVGSR
jgi:glutaminyl-tRNA synthetase